MEEPEIHNASKRSQSDKATYYMLSTVWYSGKRKTMQTVKRLVVAQGWWLGGALRNFRAMELFCTIL